MNRHYPSRRSVVGSLAAVGALSAIPDLGRAAVRSRAIDFHHHYNAPFLANTPGMLNWDIGNSLEDLDRAGIGKAVLSPPTGFAAMADPMKRADLVRQVNEFGAQLGRDHPERYRQFIYMPLPDVDAALKEIEYGFDTLKGVGAGFATSYGGKYVSDPAFAPVFEELNRRKAIAYFHPVTGACCTKVMPEAPVEMTLLEIPYDTARAVVGLLLSGAFRKYRDIKFVFSHSGGAVPMFGGRFERLLQNTDLTKIAPDGIAAEFKRLYYETANASSPPAMAALLKFAPLSQILFGSDHPYVSDADNMEDLKSCALSARQMNAILYENGERLAPQLKG